MGIYRPIQHFRNLRLLSTQARLSGMWGGSLPPVLLLDGGNEHMSPCELGRVFVARFRAAGSWAERHEFASGEHGFLYDVVCRPQREAFDHVLRFLASLPGT